MSWIKENYEKAALGGAVVIALGIGASVMSGGKDLDADDVKNVPESKDYVIPGDKELSATLAKPNSDYKLTEMKLDDGRELRAFVSMPMYMKKKSDEIFGLSPDAQLHPGIPNKWWFDHKLDDYQWADAALRDSDGDGFTNGEEHSAKTDPTDKASRPELLGKLDLLDLTADKIKLSWNEFGGGKISATFSSKKDGTIYSPKGLGKDDLFPHEGAYKNHFKLLGFGEAVPEGGQFRLKFWDAEDQRNKKKYRMWAGRQTEIKDWRGKFKLNTPDGGEFMLEEGETFSLPFDKDAKKKPYLFKQQIDGDKAEIQKGDLTELKQKK